MVDRRSRAAQGVHGLSSASTGGKFPISRLGRNWDLGTEKVRKVHRAGESSASARPSLARMPPEHQAGESAKRLECKQQGSWAVAAGLSARRNRGRKVRTPQGSVPDNVRDVGFKGQLLENMDGQCHREDTASATRAFARGSGIPQEACFLRAGVRVKRCGKSAPLPL